MLPFLQYLCDPWLVSLQCNSVPFIWEDPKPDVAFQVCPHFCWVAGKGCLPPLLSARTPFAFFTRRWLKLSLVSTRTLIFLLGCFPAKCPQPVLFIGVLFPRCSTLHFPLNFIMLLPAHPSAWQIILSASCWGSTDPGTLPSRGLCCTHHHPLGLAFSQFSTHFTFHPSHTSAPSLHGLYGKQCLTEVQGHHTHFAPVMHQVSHSTVKCIRLVKHAFPLVNPSWQNLPVHQIVFLLLMCP